MPRPSIPIEEITADRYARSTILHELGERISRLEQQYLRLDQQYARIDDLLNLKTPKETTP